jgi:hypothetical protein
MENQESNYDETIEETKAFEQVHEVAYKFIPKGYHTWRQQGYYLVCKS